MKAGKPEMVPFLKTVYTWVNFMTPDWSRKDGMNLVSATANGKVQDSPMDQEEN